MSDRLIPASVARNGIATVTDNLPEGAGVDLASDAVRIFRAEIEARLFGWRKPLTVVKKTQREAGVRS